ncbi:hypothetical protein DMJ13_00725 [halophilic archaeon]|nr:hypothetical protein DMJ13_00725 [halophilic archaeon]
MSGDEPNADRAQDRAVERQHERTERVEETLGQAGEMLGEHKYPASSEELAAEYGDQRLDLANETESLGSVFDRLVDERFESADEAREAVYNEVTGEAGGSEEYNDERPLGELDDAETDDRTDASGQ